MSAVVLIVGSSMADAVGGIGRSYRGVFEKLGYEFIEINLPDKENALRELNALIHKNVALAFSFMAMGTDINVNLEDGKSADIWEVLRVPYISLYGDSPSYYFDRHVLRNPSYVALYGFPEHYELRKRFPHINGMISTYSPMAIDVIEKDSVDWKEKANGPVILLKNGNDPKKMKAMWLASLSPKINSILHDLAAELEARIDNKATTQIDDVVLAYFKNRGIDIEPLPKLRLFLIAQLDDYLRRVKSTMLVESLLDMPVLLNGYNWEHIDFTGRRLQYVPGGHYVTSRDLIQRSLALLDMSPNTGLSPHDRPLRAIGAHTLCVTNEQEFFKRELPHTDHYFYQFHPDSIRERVTAIMANPQRTLEVGIDVAETFMQKFPPELFAHKVLECAALARFNQLPGLPEGLPNYFSWPPTKL
jgi:hypothetical protein